jgi:hypothetical protein
MTTQADKILSLLEDTTKAKKHLDKELGANKDENVLQSLQKPWQEINAALEFATGSSFSKEKDFSTEVNRAWKKCLSLLAKKSWGIEDIEIFKQEWKGGILLGLKSVQKAMEKKDPGFWKPIGKAWKDINKFLTS